MVTAAPDSLAALILRLFNHLAAADALAYGEVAGMEPLGDSRRRSQAIYSHLAAVEHTWLARLLGRAPAYALWPDLSLDAARALAEDSAQGFLSQIAVPGWLDESATYANSAGERFSNRVSDVLAHVALHGSYHRGQLALLARQGSSTPAITDYIAYLREKGA